MAKTTISIRHLLAAAVATALLASPICSKPISQDQAELAVIGWLNSDQAPMGELLGDQIAWTDAYVDEAGVAVYYIVYLDPSGYVIVAGDDLVEPIVGFVTGYSLYDYSQDNVLGALVGRDLMSRVQLARQVDARLSGQMGSTLMTTREVAAIKQSLEARGKWGTLDASAIPMPGRISGISDVRVAPLVATKWSQGNVGSTYCYNYFTPNHYVDGCVATAMTQFMRYWQWPTAGVGIQSSTIRVSGVSQTASTRGGDGAGGPYNWRQMPLVPDSSMTDTQRQAIGSICYDAGVAAHMQYSSGGSGAWMRDARTALNTTFKYSNAVIGGNESTDIGASLKDMINTNLDAASPVLLAIYEYSNGQYGGGHAIVADGYGYNTSTLYHHLNLGWGGTADAWYNLPTVDTGYYTFSIVVACIYNVYTTGTGEIISGRITDDDGTPIPGAVVTATGTGGPYTVISNYNGIYALVKVRPNTTYTITASVPGCTFNSQSVTTGSSTNWATTTGNRWSVNFTTSDTLPTAPSTCASITYPATSATGIYQVSWAAADNASAYEVMRSLDGGNSWVPVYAGTATSFNENVPTGIYRYAVHALSGGGTSAWTGGSGDCTVNTNNVPVAPTSISYPATNNTGSYTVSWASSVGATSYTLRRSSNAGSTWTQIYSGASPSYTDTVANGSYRYSVSASNGSGTSDEKVGTSDCVVRIAPPGPASITYPATSSTGKFTVTWASSAGASSYTLQRSADGGTTWTQVYSGRNRPVSQTLTNGAYKFRITASSGSATSNPTTGGYCIVAIPPAAPRSISYPSTTATGIYTVTWAGSAGASSYVLRRSADNGATWTQVYAGSTTRYSESLNVAGSYKYSVAAVGAAASAWKTGTGKCTLVAPAVPSAISYPGSNLTGNYAVSWAAPTGAVSYTLQRSSDGGKNWLTVCTGSPSTSYTDYVMSGAYKYRVAAVGRFGTSNFKTGSPTCKVTH